MNPTVVLTRPEGNNTGLEGRLSEQGFGVLVQPILQIVALADGEQLPLEPLTQADTCLFISANAVRMGLPHLSEWLNHSDPEAQPTWLAVGAATADALAQSGLVAQTPEQPDSEGLLALPALQNISGRRVVIVKGEGGRQVLADVLRDRGAKVEEFVCYRRQAVPVDAEAFGQQLSAQKRAVFQANSGETLELLTEVLDRGGHLNLLAHPVIVPSARVAKRAVALGWQQVVQADSAGDDAFIAALQGFLADDAGELSQDRDPAVMENVTVATDKETSNSDEQRALETEATQLPEQLKGVTPQPAPRRADWVARFLLLLVLLALGAGGYGAWQWVWPQWQGLHSDKAALNTKIDAIEAAQKSLQGTVAQAVATRLSEVERGVAASLEQQLATQASARAETNAGLERLTERLDRLEIRLARLTATDRRAWLTNEAAFLTRLAAQRLLTARDVDAAEALLLNADTLLAEANDPRLEQARRALANDRTALAVAARVDTVGLYAQFSALIDQAAALTVVIAPPKEAAATFQADAGWLENAEAGWRAALAKLSDYLVVRRRDTAMSRMMTPDWEVLTRQNLRMLLEQAQIAALSGNQALYDTALERGSAFVAEFAEADPLRVAAIQTQLETLATVNVAPLLPDLLASRAALADAIRLIDGQAAMAPEAALEAAEVLKSNGASAADQAEGLAETPVPPPESGSD